LNLDQRLVTWPVAVELQPLEQVQAGGGDLALLAEALHVEAGAGGGGGQEQVERRGGRGIAAIADGLVGVDGEAVEVGVNPRAAGEVNINLHGQFLSG
jgi:hypothetical protein